MILHLEKYDILAVNGIDKENFVSIIDRESNKVIDHAIVDLKILNELEKDITFEVMSLTGKAEKIFKETNCLVEIVSEAVKQFKEREESLKENNKEESDANL